MDSLVSDLLHQYMFIHKVDGTEFYKLSFDGKIYFIVRTTSVSFQPYDMYHIKKWGKDLDCNENLSYNLTYTTDNKWHNVITMAYLGEEPYHMSLKNALLIVELDKL